MRPDVVRALAPFKDEPHEAVWCPTCFRVLVNRVGSKHTKVAVEGSSTCCVTLKSGTVEDCIADAQRVAANRA